MVRRHGAARVRALIECCEHVDGATRIPPEVVPFVAPLPLARQGRRRRMCGIFDVNRGVLDLRVTGEICTDERTVERPVIFRVGCRVNPDKSTAPPDKSLEGCFLCG